MSETIKVRVIEFRDFDVELILQPLRDEMSVAVAAASLNIVGPLETQHHGHLPEGEQASVNLSGVKTIQNFAVAFEVGLRRD
jgi:hypothetical protein